jgi:hypothetical protein
MGTKLRQDQIQNLDTDLSAIESIDDSLESLISQEISENDSIDQSLDSKISKEISENDVIDYSLESAIDSIEIAIGATGSGFSKKTFGVTINGGDSDITTGIKGDIVIPYNLTITGWTIVSQQTGDIVIDVWKSNYQNFPPTALNSIAGLQKPTLSDSKKNKNTNLTSWTSSISSGDIIRFNVDSCSGINMVNLVIEGNLVI